MRKKKAQQHKRLLLLGCMAVVVVSVIALSAAFSSKGVDKTDPLPVSTETITPEHLGAMSLDSASRGVIALVSPVPVETEPVLESLGEFVLTAYCPCVKCCGEWSAEHPSRVGTDYIQKTASGTIPTAGRTISVDTSVIPFGTTVIIHDHEYVAEDRGGAIKGNKIDIFFDDHDEALEFGRQTAEVFITNNKED